MRTKWMTLLVLLVTMISLLLPAVASAAPARTLNAAAAATVQVVVVDDEGDGLGAGSGSLITADGLILTNYHVVAENPRRDDTLLVRVPHGVRQHDYQLFTGRTLVVDADADLAVVQLLADENGNALTAADFPTIALGDSDGLDMGDDVFALGYPDIGSEQLVMTQGMVSGFLADAEDPWILSDVLISNGNSGGAAVNAQGELVAIPTSVRVGEQSAATMAYLRPVNHALPLIEQARAAQRSGENAQQAADADVITLIGQEIGEIERMTVNGKHTSELAEIINNLFVDAIWKLQPDSTFQLETVNGDEPVYWEGQWNYDERTQQAFLESDLFEATLFTEDDAWYLHVQMNTRVEDVGRIRAEFYQAVLFQDDSAASSTAESLTLTIKNNTRTKICYVYISPATDEDWGDDWLGRDEMIRPRQQREFTVPAGDYDLLVQDCDGNEISQLADVALYEDSTWTVK